MYKCKKCGGTEYEGDTWVMWGATFGKCAKCKECAIVIESSVEYEEYCKQLAEGKAAAKRPPTIECPYCHSTDTKKISGTSRLMSTGLFGLASGKLGKQWHCNKCRSDF